RLTARGRQRQRQGVEFPCRGTRQYRRSRRADLWLVSGKRAVRPEGPLAPPVSGRLPKRCVVASLTQLIGASVSGSSIWVCFLHLRRSRVRRAGDGAGGAAGAGHLAPRRRRLLKRQMAMNCALPERPIRIFVHLAHAFGADRWRAKWELGCIVGLTRSRLTAIRPTADAPAMTPEHSSGGGAAARRRFASANLSRTARRVATGSPPPAPACAASRRRSCPCPWRRARTTRRRRSRCCGSSRRATAPRSGWRGR